MKTQMNTSNVKKYGSVSVIFLSLFTLPTNFFPIPAHSLITVFYIFNYLVKLALAFREGHPSTCTEKYNNQL